jgi:hypothetical protein
MSFVNFFNKKNKSKDSNSSYDSDSDKSDKFDRNDKYVNNDNDTKYNKNTRYDTDDKDNRDNRDERDNRDNREDNREDNRDDRDDRDDRDNRDDRYDSDNDDREDRDDYYKHKKTDDYYDPRKDQSIKNLDNFLYKKNIQIMKIFKMRNRCILILVLMKESGKCVLIYVDPSKHEIECQSNNSIVGRENVHNIELFRIDHKHIYEVCDCYPELMKLTQEHRINIQNEKNKVYLNHFEQICIQLNNFKKIVKSSKSKLGIITEYSISFINTDNDVELFTVSDTSPKKFSKMKTYLVYDLNTFMNSIDEVEFEIERLIPSFIEELTKDNKDLRKQLETNSVLNNINSVKSLLDKLEIKKKRLMNDSMELKEMFKTAKRNLNKEKSKRDNVQQRFTVEKLENTKQEVMYFAIDVDDEYNNLLSHTLNLMHLIDKQCNNINEHIEFIKKYCEFD